MCLTVCHDVFEFNLVFCVNFILDLSCDHVKVDILAQLQATALFLMRVSFTSSWNFKTS